MGLGSYLRFIGRFLVNQPQFWKAIAVDVAKWIRKPSTEVMGGTYILLGGLLGAVMDAIYPSSIRSLTNPQWGLIFLVGFFLLTHGLYRSKEEAEA